MNARRGTMQDESHNAIRNAEQKVLGTDGTIRVLFVGLKHMEDAALDALFEGLHSRIYATTDTRELWVFPSREPIRLAILHQTLSLFELEEASRSIRQRWPGARILVIREGEEFLDDGLYDDRVVPPITPGALLETTRRLLSRRRA